MTVSEIPPAKRGEGGPFRFCINRMHPLYLLIFSWNRIYYINSRVCFGSAGSWEIWPRISRTCLLPDSTRHLAPLRQSAYQNLAITRPPSFACLFTDPATRRQTSFNRVGENVCPLVFSPLPPPFPIGRARPRENTSFASTTNKLETKFFRNFHRNP